MYGSDSCVHITMRSTATVTAVPKGSIPSMADVLRVARSKGVSLELKSYGPFFRVVATKVGTGSSAPRLGTANGFVRPWAGGQILHLDSIRLTTESKQIERPLFGIALLIGAAAIRHGFECGCVKAELLAIKDSELYHSKLVRFYERVGFKAVREVTGEVLNDVPHMLVWGGVGTRMDALILELLWKWSSYFKRGQF